MLCDPVYRPRAVSLAPVHQKSGITVLKARPGFCMNDQHTTSADSFISHLVELRRRVIRALLAVALVFLGLVGWAADIFRWLARPLLMNLPKDGKMIVTDVTGSFFVPVKVTLLLVIALPFVLYQLWAFVAPGLYRHERKWIAPLVGSSYALFLAGMAFAYF